MPRDDINIRISAQDEASAAINRASKSINDLATQSTKNLRDMVGGFSRATMGISQFTAGIQVMHGGMAGAIAGMTTMSAGLKNMSAGLNNILGLAGKTGAGFMGLKVAIAAVAVTGIAGTAAFVAMGKESMAVGRQLENLNVQLKVFLGSQQRANEAVKIFREFATKSPFQLQEIQNAGRLLLAFGFRLEDINGLLEDMGDLAAGTGRGIEEIALVFGRIKGGAFGEAFERLRMMGIDVRSFKPEMFSRSGEVLMRDSEQMLKVVRGLIGEKGFRGMQAEMAKTLDGIKSMLSDAFFNFKAIVAQSGLYEKVKEVFQNILDAVNELSTKGKLEEWGNAIGKSLMGLIDALTLLAPKLETVIKLMDAFVAFGEKSTNILSTMMRSFSSQGPWSVAGIERFYKYMTDRDFMESWDRMAEQGPLNFTKPGIDYLSPNPFNVPVDFTGGGSFKKLPSIPTPADTEAIERAKKLAEIQADIAREAFDKRFFGRKEAYGIEGINLMKGRSFIVPQMTDPYTWGRRQAREQIPGFPGQVDFERSGRNLLGGMPGGGGGARLGLGMLIPSSQEEAKMLTNWRKISSELRRLFISEQGVFPSIVRAIKEVGAQSASIAAQISQAVNAGFSTIRAGFSGAISNLLFGGRYEEIGDAVGDLEIILQLVQRVDEAVLRHGGGLANAQQTQFASLFSSALSNELPESVRERIQGLQSQLFGFLASPTTENRRVLSAGLSDAIHDLSREGNLINRMMRFGIDLKNAMVDGFQVALVESLTGALFGGFTGLLAGLVGGPDDVASPKNIGKEAGIKIREGIGEGIGATGISFNVIARKIGSAWVDIRDFFSDKTFNVSAGIARSAGDAWEMIRSFSDKTFNVSAGIARSAGDAWEKIGEFGNKTFNVSAGIVRSAGDAWEKVEELTRPIGIVINSISGAGWNEISTIGGRIGNMFKDMFGTSSTVTQPFSQNLGLAVRNAFIGAGIASLFLPGGEIGIAFGAAFGTLVGAAFGQANIGGALGGIIGGLIDKIVFQGARGRAAGDWKEMLTDIQAFGGIKGFFERIGGTAGIRGGYARVMGEGRGAADVSEFEELIRIQAGLTKDQAELVRMALEKASAGESIGVVYNMVGQLIESLRRIGIQTADIEELVTVFDQPGGTGYKLDITGPGYGDWSATVPIGLPISSGGGRRPSATLGAEEPEVTVPPPTGAAALRPIFDSFRAMAGTRILSVSGIHSLRNSFGEAAIVSALSSFSFPDQVKSVVSMLAGGLNPSTYEHFLARQAGFTIGARYGAIIPGPDDMPVPVIAHGGEAIVSATQARTMNGLGGGTININININGTGDAELLRLIREKAIPVIQSRVEESILRKGRFAQIQLDNRAIRTNLT